MKFYVTAVIVVEKPTAQAAVEAVAALTAPAWPSPARDAVRGLDYEGEPILEVFVDDPRGPQLVSPEDYTVPEKP